MTRRVLVVEDEFIIADEIMAMLTDAGYEVIGPVGSLAEAETAMRARLPDFAVVDANLRGQSSGALVDKLRDKRVPVCLCTGYRVDDMRTAFGDVPILQKPVDGRALIAVVDSALKGRD